MFLPVNGEDVVGLANVAFSVEEHVSIERLGLDGSTFLHYSALNRRMILAQETKRINSEQSEKMKYNDNKRIGRCIYKLILDID